MFFCDVLILLTYLTYLMKLLKFVSYYSDIDVIQYITFTDPTTRLNFFVFQCLMSLMFSTLPYTCIDIHVKLYRFLCEFVARV